jgi:peptidoglycan/LPS O-acetylase OafA/YrhL
VPAAVRYTWMFRTAAVVFIGLGLAWLWTFALTDFRPEQRPYGLAAGVLALLVGIFLLRRHRGAIGVSAAAATVVGLSAAVFAPISSGPAILFLAALAIVCGLYAVFAVRVLTAPRESGGK